MTPRPPAARPAPLPLPPRPRPPPEDWRPPAPFLGVRRPLLMAHAGASARAPENTLPAFAGALAAGANVLEMDVHLTADDQVVVLHDPTLTRTTDATGAVTTMAYAEVARADAGAEFIANDGSRPFAGQGIVVPTLDAVLAQFPGVPLNIELKASDAALVPRVLAILAAGAPAPVLLAAQDDAIQQRLRAARPPHALGLSAAEGRAVARAYFAHWTTWVATAAAWPGRAGDVLGRWRGAGIAPGWRGHALQPPLHHAAAPGGRVATPGFIRALHNAGLQMHVWTVNDPREAARLLADGVDGIFTDDPAALAPLFAARWAQLPPESARGLLRGER